MQEGKRFSQMYLERGAPVRDSQRFRNRLGAYLNKNFINDIFKIGELIHTETGVEPSWNQGPQIAKFLEKAEMRDVLDAITLIYQVVNNRHYEAGHDWKTFVERVMREENVGYRLDSKCGVHFFIDEEFERNRFAAVSALDSSELQGVRDAYEAAYSYLDNDPPDTKAAVRSMFEALEILVRQMIPATKNLNRWVVENPLKERCVQLYQSEPTAKTVVSGLFDGFADWVNALQNYRHGQPSEQPVAPTIEVAVYVLSSGSSFLRWLIGMNNDLQSVGK